jgi:hypothetical protein
MYWRGCVLSDAAILTDVVTRDRSNALVAALTRLGLVCAVEDRDGLAILHASANVVGRLTDPALRRRVVALGRSHGFTHVAATVNHA